MTGKDYSMTQAFEALKGLPVIGPGGPGKPPVPELILRAKPELIVMSSVLVETYDPDKLQEKVRCPVMVLGLSPSGHVDVQELKRVLFSWKRSWEGSRGQKFSGVSWKRC